MIELGLKVTLAYLVGAVLGSLARRLLLRRRRHPQGRQRQRRRHERAAHAGQGIRALGHGHRHRQGHLRGRRDSAACDSRRRHRSRGRPLARALRASLSPRSRATCFPCGSGSAAARAARRPRVSSAISRPAAALPVLGSWLADRVHDGLRRPRDDQRGARRSRSSSASPVLPEQSGLFVFACGTAVLLIYAHRGNIRRMLDGTESRFSQPGGALVAPRPVDARDRRTACCTPWPTGERIRVRSSRARSASRAPPIWKQVGKLADWGLAVEAAPGAGYRLPRRLDLLDAGRAACGARRPASRRGSRSSKYSRSSTRRTAICSLAPPRRRQARRLHRGVPDARAAAGAAAAGARRSAAAIALSVGWQFAGMPAELVGADARRRRRRAARARAHGRARRSRSSGRTISSSTSASSAASCSSSRPRRTAARTSSQASGSMSRCLPLCCRRSAIGRAAPSISRRRSAASRRRARCSPPRSSTSLRRCSPTIPTQRFRRVSHRVARRRFLARPRRAPRRAGGTPVRHGARHRRRRRAAVETAAGERRRVVAGDVSVRSVR